MIAVEQVRPPRASVQPVQYNPFVPISDIARAAIIVYFALWRILPAVAGFPATDTANTSYALLITLTHVAIELLILMPFLVTRFGGIQIGWLNPLILPTIISIAFGVLSHPASLLTPFTAWNEGGVKLTHPLLTAWPEWRLLNAELKRSAIDLLALACTYIGFYIIGRRRLTPKRSKPNIRVRGYRIAILFAILIAVTFGFLQSRGGVISHMASLSAGRAVVGKFSGHFIVLVTFMPYLLIFWYAYNPNAVRNPLFIFALILASALQFVVTGSRGSTFRPAAALLIVWIYHHRKLPAVRGALLGIAAVLAIGVLGVVRNSGRGGDIDFSALTEFNLSTSWELTQSELEGRSRDIDLALAALVPDERDYLYGETYIGVIAFWLPRSIWPDKPRGVGAYAAGLLYMGRETIEGYEGASYPVNGPMEAYWNFSYFGITSIYLLYGSLLGAVARWLVRSPGNPLALTSLIIMAMRLTQPRSDFIIPAMQIFIILFVAYIISAKLTWRK